MTKHRTLEQILIDCAQSTERDVEGDNTYRLHYKKAMKLISEAYHSGVARAFNKKEDNKLEE